MMSAFFFFRSPFSRWFGWWDQGTSVMCHLFRPPHTLLKRQLSPYTPKGCFPSFCKLLLYILAIFVSSLLASHFTNISTKLFTYFHQFINPSIFKLQRFFKNRTIFIIGMNNIYIFIQRPEMNSGRYGAPVIMSWRSPPTHNVPAIHDNNLIAKQAVYPEYGLCLFGRYYCIGSSPMLPQRRLSPCRARQHRRATLPKGRRR